ncbi:hypothetical protein OSTOST_05599 [Ostertagia ostertagi]
MLRWSLGISRLDHVCNEVIRRRVGVAPITEKMRERRLQWYGHVIRAAPDTVAATAYRFEVDGKRPLVCEVLCPDTSCCEKFGTEDDRRRNPCKDKEFFNSLKSKTTRPPSGDLEWSYVFFLASYTYSPVVDLA